MFMLALAGWAAPPFLSTMGRADRIGTDTIAIQARGRMLQLYADRESKIWRGQWGKHLSAVRPGDEVIVRYRINPAGRAVIADLYANIEHVWGRVVKLTSTGFEVWQNPNSGAESGAHPRYCYVTVTPGTDFQFSSRSDVRVGRNVDVIGLARPNSRVQAARVIVYEGNAPVQMPPNAPALTVDGSMSR